MMDANEAQVNIIQIAAEAGAKAGIEAFNRQRRLTQAERADRRLRNTKLLLRNYRRFKDHCESAVFEAKLHADENAESFFDVMDTLDLSDSSTLYVESIQRSAARTLIIIQHIDAMLQLYDIYCAKSRNPEEERRNQVIHKLYIDENPMTVKELSECFCVTNRTIYKDIDIACERISALIFGIDGMSM